MKRRGCIDLAFLSRYKRTVPYSLTQGKIAGTYEGIAAAKALEQEGIHCNVTLVFSLIQAAACAENGVFLISPFVGRILDWHKQKTGQTFTAENDPGVLSVKNIYSYFKKFKYSTIVMGASFRNKEEILALAGCDKLTIAPTYLDALKSSYDDVTRQLDPADDSYTGEKIDTSESAFRFALNEDAMATEKLAEGIRLFSADIRKLETMIISKLSA